MKSSLSVSAVALLVAYSGSASADVLAGHQVRLDAEGKLLAWSEPQDAAYGHVMKLSWDRIKTWPRVEANGLKTYLTHPTFDEASLAGLDYPNIPAGHHAMSTDSAVRYYGYTGDVSDLAIMREMLDHQLAHGTSPSSWVYGSMPWASSDPGQVNYFGSTASGGTCGRGDGPGATEPDKGAELGYAYLQAYEVTGEKRYLDAAILIANTLVKTRREGDALRSPWPFRVMAETGVVREEYASNSVGPLTLFDELVRLGEGDVAGYRTARNAVWAWLLAYPYRTKHWSGGFEDQPFYHDPARDPTQYIPLKITQYLLEHPEVDPDWRAHAADVIAWVEAEFAIDTPTEKGVQYGANVISEQKVFMAKMGNHTARYASVLGLWYERTGDLAAKEKAFRSLNWATYVCRPNGLVSYSPTANDWWFATGYGDYVRNFMTALGAVPAFAPAHQNHLLRTSSVASAVGYAPGAIRFHTFAPKAIDVLRVAMTSIEISVDGKALAARTDLEAEGFTLDDLGRGDYVLRIRHDSGRDVVVGGIPSVVPPPDAAPAPATTSPPPSPTPSATRPLALDAGGGGGCGVGGRSAGVGAGLALLCTLVLARGRRR